MGFIEGEEVIDHPTPPEPSPEMLAEAIRSYSISRSAADPASTTTPQLPPSMDAYRNLSSAEILADLNKAPLFMTELEDNDELDAFKALAYEGTPSEIAQNFKEQGNDIFKAKSWADAKEFYSKAISVLQTEQRKRVEEQTLKEGLAKSAKGDIHPVTTMVDDETEVKEQLMLLEACLGNRSACHVQLKNYRSATLDCAQVLRLNPRNTKAFYRSGVALLALSKIREADDACARGLALDPHHKDLKLLAEQITQKAKEVDEKKRKEQEAEMRRKQEEYVLRAALKARGIYTRKTAQPPDMEDAKVRLVPDPADPTSSLVFPTVLLYPLVLQSDFIKEFGETETVGERLSYILAEPAPWDQDREYSPIGVECYMETMSGGLIKVGRDVSLLKVLGSGSVEVVDEVVRIFVVPKRKSKEWVEEFKRKKAAEKGA